MHADNVHAAMVADDLYDQDIPIDRKCPVCGRQMYMSPDCIESCLDDKCSFDGIAEYKGEFSQWKK